MIYYTIFITDVNHSPKAEAGGTITVLLSLVGTRHIVTHSSVYIILYLLQM